MKEHQKGHPAYINYTWPVCDTKTPNSLLFYNVGFVLHYKAHKAVQSHVFNIQKAALTIRGLDWPRVRSPSWTVCYLPRVVRAQGTTAIWNHRHGTPALTAPSRTGAQRELPQGLRRGGASAPLLPCDWPEVVRRRVAQTKLLDEELQECK